jgi:hypothetical protein
MDPQDPSTWRRLPSARESWPANAGPGESPPGRTAVSAEPGSRDRGIRHVRRLSNWTAVMLVAATAVTAGYFARASVSASRPATTVTRSQSAAASSRQPCVTVPVATSGGSGVSVQTPVQACALGANGTRPVIVYVNSGERRGDL